MENENRTLAVEHANPAPVGNLAFEKILRGMESEVSWFKREAERRSLAASQTVIAASRIAQLVEVERHLAVYEKLMEWSSKIRAALNTL